MSNKIFTTKTVDDTKDACINHLENLGAKEICNVAKQGIKGEFQYTVSPESASKILLLNESSPDKTDPVKAITDGLDASSVSDSRYKEALHYALDGNPEKTSAFLWGTLNRAKAMYDGPGEVYLVTDEGLFIFDSEYVYEHCMDGDFDDDPYGKMLDAAEALTDCARSDLKTAYLVIVTYDMAMDMWLDKPVARCVLSMVCHDLMKDGDYDTYFTDEGLMVLNLARLKSMSYRD